jgi:hypothetical protein
VKLTNTFFLGGGAKGRINNLLNQEVHIVLSSLYKISDTQNFRRMFLREVRSSNLGLIIQNERGYLFQIRIRLIYGMQSVLRSIVQAY